MNENRVYIRSCKMVLWSIRARVLFELFYEKSLKVDIFSISPSSDLHQSNWRRDNIQNSSF